MDDDDADDEYDRGRVQPDKYTENRAIKSENTFIKNLFFLLARDGEALGCFQLK